MIVVYRAEEYTYRVFWSEEDQVFVSTVVEFPSLSNVDEDRITALNGMSGLLAFVLKDMESKGEEIPPPLGKRYYSGKISLRMNPEQHRRIAMEAAEQGVSINQLLVSRI